MTKKQSIKNELEQIRLANGGLIRPADVVDYARTHKKSALHSEFDWNNKSAAEKYRIVQARRMIQVHITVEPRTQQKVRAFVSLPQDRATSGGGYRDVDDVLSDEEMRQQLLSDALASLAAYRRKYAILEELHRVFSEIDAFVEQSQSKAV